MMADAVARGIQKTMLTHRISPGFNHTKLKNIEWQPKTVRYT